MLNHLFALNCQMDRGDRGAEGNQYQNTPQLIHIIFDSFSLIVSFNVVCRTQCCRWYRLMTKKITLVISFSFSFTFSATVIFGIFVSWPVLVLFQSRSHPCHLFLCHWMSVKVGAKLSPILWFEKISIILRHSEQCMDFFWSRTIIDQNIYCVYAMEANLNVNIQ